MNEETLGRRISAHRKRLAMTQDAMAEQLGVTAQAVSKWENDQSCPDIAMLPRLAEMFGITIDELLGFRAKPAEVSAPAVRAEQIPEKVPVGRAKRTGIGVALWLLLTGVYLMAVCIMPLRMDYGSVWKVAGLTGLTVYGLLGIYPQFRVFRLGCGLAGGYGLYCGVTHPTVQIREELWLPLLLVLLGAGLLADAIRGKKSPGGHMAFNAAGKNIFEYSGNSFVCSNCFGQEYRSICLPELEGGEGNVFFGDITIDIHDCGYTAENCCIALRCAFGTLTLSVPRNVQLQCINKTLFGRVQEYGSPDPSAASVIRVENAVCFGEIHIKYI